MQDQISQNITFLSKEYPDIEYIKLLKSGKEAEVHLVSAKDELFALKIYRQFQKYASRGDYLHIHELGGGQVMRAVRNKTRAGKRILADIWVNREYELLRKMYDRGASVPGVEALGQNGFLMEYFGDEDNPAPRLIDVELTSTEAITALSLISQNIWLLLELGYVHGDLSGYNILWWENEPIIIDFPQVLSVFHNSDAPAKLRHDISQINSYFGKYGCEISEAEVAEMQMLILV
jgi:RIO kinase 1